MKKNVLIAIAGFIAAGTIGTVVLAATPAETIAARQAGMKQIGAAFRAINEQLRAPAPSTDAIRGSSADLARAAGNVGLWFPAGTGVEAGVKTAASPAIWEGQSDFGTQATQFAAAARNFEAAASSGDIDAIRAAAGPVGQACRSCHMTFRTRI